MNQDKPQGATIVVEKQKPYSDDWIELVKLANPSYHPTIKTAEAPFLVVLQHRQTLEILVKIYNRVGGLKLTYTNAGLPDEDKQRHQKWFRDIVTNRGEYQHPVRVRFMCQNESHNVDLVS